MKTPALSQRNLTILTTETLIDAGTDDPLERFVSQYKPHFEQFLSDRLAQLTQSIARTEQAGPLVDALAYSSLAGGKRIRAMLVYMAAQACGTPQQGNGIADTAAAAVELIHCYSLIHDDLPAMDDDDLRRGKPSCHIRFGEATAILAGDALQALAFELLACDGEASANLRLNLVRQLSQAAGANGMVGGQAIDLAVVDQTPDYEALVNMHRLKTGALIEAATLMGCLCGGGNDSQARALRQYAQAIGLAFQVIDDILDIEGKTSELGKPQGADIQANKPTYPSIIGLDAAKREALELHRQALAALQGFNQQADPLRALASFIIERAA